METRHPRTRTGRRPPAGTLRAGVLLPATLAAALATVLAACGPLATAGPGCRTLRAPVALPPGLEESSGVAVSLRHPGILWTHDDAGDLLHAVDREGTRVGTVRLPERLRDWEDLALASCPRGGSCLWAADTGDNYEERDDVRLLRFPEPDPTADTVATPDVHPVRLPDGPRDVEALLVLPGERILLVTKGRNHPVTVYRYPLPLRPERVTLVAVQRLTDGPRILPRQVTGGAVAPRGGLAALRTYESLRFYRVAGDTLAPVEDGLVNLRTLREPQGEGVGLGLDGEVVLTSEGGPGGGPGSVAALRCRLEGLWAGG